MTVRASSKREIGVGKCASEIKMNALDYEPKVECDKKEKVPSVHYAKFGK